MLDLAQRAIGKGGVVAGLPGQQAAGLGPARVTLQRAPAWTTDWITERGRARLLAYGIAPPGPLPPGTEETAWSRARVVQPFPGPRLLV